MEQIECKKYYQDLVKCYDEYEQSMKSKRIKN